MCRLSYLVFLLLTPVFAATANSVTVRNVKVSDSHTYTIEGSGFSPKKGAAPVVTINGLAVTLKSFTNTHIVGSLATPVASDYTLKITNSQGSSTTFKAVVEPSQKADSSAVGTGTEQKTPPVSTGSSRTISSERAHQRLQPGDCQIHEVTPGIPVPPLPSDCFEQ